MQRCFKDIRDVTGRGESPGKMELRQKSSQPGCKCLLSSSAIFSSLRALWRVRRADGKRSRLPSGGWEGVPGVQGEKKP